MSTTEETSIVEMRICCIKIGIVLVLHPIEVLVFINHKQLKYIKMENLVKKFYFLILLIVDLLHGITNSTWQNNI
jgi:hypothetical protein